MCGCSINGVEELRQLVTNLTYALVQRDVLSSPSGQPELEAIIDSAGEVSDACAWSLDDFQSWYKTSVMERLAVQTGAGKSP